MKRLILVGDGLAGTVLALRLRHAGFRVQLIGRPELSSCSRVAAGIWNPLVFKRMTASWMAQELITELLRFYRQAEQETGRSFLQLRTSVRAFSEEQEKTLWKRKSRNELDGFADPEIYEGQPRGFENCNLPNGYAYIQQSGNLNIGTFMAAVKQSLGPDYVQESFVHQELQIMAGGVRYRQHEADAIVFCEGYLVKDNPFFNWIPLKPAKGELLHILPKDKLFNKGLLHRNGFLMDLDGGQYLIGATYEWDQLNDRPTEGARHELEQRTASILKGGFRVLEHLAGVRPSSIDRRPVIGSHPKHRRLFIFNGLGSKGVMLAPWFALKFVHFLQQSGTLPREADVARFYRHHEPEHT